MYKSIASIRKIFFLSIFLFFIISCFSSSTIAQESKEPIIVNGDKVEYLYEQKKIIGINNIVITYKGVTLTCDKIVVYMDTKEAEAFGNVILTQEDSVFKGERIYYNFETQKGTIIEAEAKAKPWYGKGESVSKVEEKKYVIDRGYLTTCNLPHPHYRIQARRVKIYLDDRVEAYHVIFFLGKYPVFYFPYYVHPLKDKRPRVTIVPGRNSRWGYYLLTAWRYYLHEWSRGYIRLDWREKKGYGEGIDYKYKFGYFGKGLARFYYTKENHVVTTEEQETSQSVGNNRWRIQLRHKWQIDPDTLAVGEFNKSSDALFIKDYFFREEYEREFQNQTYFSVIRTKPNYNLELLLRMRVNSFYTVVERLPELRLELKNQRLGDTDFYYKSTTSFAMLQKKFDDSLYQPKLKANRFDTEHRFSYLRKIFGFLSFNPYIGIRETWFSEDAMDKKNKLRHVYTTGVNLSTKFYRVFPVKTNLLALDINGLKHIITPSIGYNYTPTPNIKPDALKQFDKVDEVNFDHSIGLSLVNRLQTKRGKEKSITNLVRFETATALLLKPKDNNEILSDVNFNLECYPYEWLRFYVDTTYNPKNNRIDTVGLDVVAEKEELWRFGFGYRFEMGRMEDSSSQIVADALYKISPKWKIRAYNRYKKDPDMERFELEELNVGIERDLHCWLAELNYQYKKTDGLEVDKEHRVWLVMRIKAFPELPFKMFSKRYESPRPGRE